MGSMGLFMVLLQLFAISPKSLAGRSMKVRSHGMVKDYKKKLAEVPAEEEIQELPPSKRGRPLLDEVLDDNVCKPLKALREAGSVVNRTIVIATAKGIVGHLKSGDLAEHGGHVNLTKAWAVSLAPHGMDQEKGHQGWQ